LNRVHPRSWLRCCGALLVVLFGLAACPSNLAAHQMNLTNARVELRPDGVVTVQLSIKASDIDRAVGTRLHDEQTGLLDRERLATSFAPVAAYLTSHAVVRGEDGTACTAGPVKLDPDEDGLVGHLIWSCAGSPGDLVYRSTVLIDVDPTAKQVVLIAAGPDVSQALLDATHTEVRLSAPAIALFPVIERYIAAGIEHIFLGYDHIAFLIGIVLWARRIWPVVKIVTAFTVAHSITLSLAALRIVVVPSEIVEPAIAASIVYVSLENFFSRNVEKRWRITFAFGFIHGFGFASALQEFGLPRDAIVPALGAFNIGVEIGQVAIISLVIPLLMGVDWLIATPRHHKPARTAAVVYVLSAIIASLGFYWILERTVLA
jgi:hydrogenase/urease accessory protein HupE